MVERVHILYGRGVGEVDGLKRFSDPGDLLSVLVAMGLDGCDGELPALIGDGIEALHKHGTSAFLTTTATLTTRRRRAASSSRGVAAANHAIISDAFFSPALVHARPHQTILHAARLWAIIHVM
jgi:hypothetical protein